MSASAFREMLSNEEGSGNATDKFRNMVKEFVKLDDQIKEATADMKEVRKRWKDLKADILQYMENNNIGTCNIKGGKEQLCLNYREKKIRPKKPDILRKMAEFLGDSEKAIKLYDFVFTNTETEPSTSLSRKTSVKGKKMAAAKGKEEKDA